MEESPEKDKSGRCCKKMCIIAGPLFGIVLAIILFLLINVSMEQVSSSEYCGTNCHEMQTAYDSWKLTPHAVNARGLSAGCVQCHLPPENHYFRHLIAKGIAGMKDLYKHHFGGEYDGEKIREIVLEEFENSTCIHCHTNLLDKPGSDVAKESHEESLNPSDPEEAIRCVDCHEDAGHVREVK
jgi:cytochrome c-type protein NapC/trimethylamine-N-oxide reductase cytochrome c-type subunit TorC